MSIMPVDMAHFEIIEKVAAMKNMSKTDTAVAKQLGLTRVQVKQYYQDYKTALANDSGAHERAMDLLNVMIEQYDMLIDDSYSLLTKIRAENFDDKYANQEAKVLALIGEFIAKRLKAVQDAGLLENSELGDEYADMEEKANILMSILRNDLCADCRIKVKDKFAVATNQVEAVVVYED